MNRRHIALVGWSVALGAATWAALGTGADPKPTPAPELTDVTAWVNTKPLKLADQKGRVVVLHFWTHGCFNCVNNYPHYRAWQKAYKDNEAFLMVGVHTPEFRAERDVDAIKAQVKKHELDFAVAVDNDGKNWKAWNNRYWPCVYLIDKTGAVRERWEGELGEKGFKQLTRSIDALLAEKVK